MKPLICKLPMLPMTANERERAHWRKLAREKDDFTKIIPLCPMDNQQPKDGPRRIVEVIFRKPRGKRAVDPDGLKYRCKSINDALQRTGWIADDDDRHIDLIVREKPIETGKRDQRSYTVIAVSLADVGELKGAA